MQKLLFIVDDTDSNLTMLASILEDDYRVLTMPSAEKMFSLLEKKRPDLILLDIEMPDMDGYEALAKLKQKPDRSGIPVMFITRHIDDTVLSRASELGALEVVSKTDAAKVLPERVKKHLT